MSELVKMGMSGKETLECLDAIPSYPYITQKEWLYIREDGIVGDQYNLT